ncbi:MAG: hypothetical protein ABSA44_09635 [Bacteroidota bacterium]|jgi:hypothetical protein
MKIPIFNKTGRKATFKDPGAGQFSFAMITVGSSADNAITNCGGISSNSYVSQMTGYRISAAGEGDFRYLYADQMRIKVFVVDQERALNGSEIISPSSTPVAANFIIPTAGASSPLVVQEFAGFTGHVFANGDIVRLRIMSRADNTTITVADVWGAVTYTSRNANANPTTQTYSFTRSAAPNAGTGSGTIPKGTIALDYGVSGNGYYEVTAVDGVNGANSPYAQTVIWMGHPATGCIEKARFGNLAGITSATWGALSGYGLYANKIYLEGNCYIKGELTFSNQGSINISGFNNDAGFITGGDLGNKTYYGSSAPGSPSIGDFWFNTYVTGQYKMNRWNGTTWDIVSVYMDGTGVYAGNITAGQVTAGTLTAFTLQTAASGKRVDVGTNNQINFYDEAGSACGYIRGYQNPDPILHQLDIYSGDVLTIISANIYYEASKMHVFYGPINGSSYINLNSGGQYKINGTALSYSDVGACGTSDYRLSDARDASDVYAWAKAATKPSYTYSEVGAQVAGSYAPASQGASFSGGGPEDRYVATTSGGSVNHRLSSIPIIINGVTNYFLVV